ncbi:MAG TPA: hypothetical protein VN515_07550 [Terriglobales bacterium]|nr:hypothetical protein [Terriglobales bacterium]
MKIGVEKKREVIALVVLAAVAVYMLWPMLAPSPPPVVAPLAAAVAPGAPAPLHLDPTLHLAKLDKLRALDYTGSGRDLFHFGSAPAIAPTASLGPHLPAHSPSAPPPRPVVPAGPPPPPPIPLKFYGFVQADGVPEKIFLQMGDDNYVVSQGDTIAHRYLIENIGKVSVRVKDLATQSEQELPLQQG